MAILPKSVRAAFDIFDAAISLDRRERDRAQTRHQEITDCLIDAGVATGTFLQGSFARKTMRRPLKDVDIVVLFPASFWRELQNNPAKALDLLKQPLRALWRDSVAFDVRGRPAKALQVVFEDCPFTFDLVAAFEDPSGGEDVLIANRETMVWERSNTRTLKRVIAERNLATAGRFVHQARMVKEFKAQHPQLEEICGLVCESLTFAAVTTALPDAQAVAATLRHASTAMFGPIMDPTGVDDLTVKWTDLERATFAAAFEAGSKRADEAMRLDAAGATAAAIDVWRSVLGEDFPAAAPQSESAALRNLAVGSVSSTGRAVATPVAVQPQRPARAWRRP